MLRLATPDDIPAIAGILEDYADYLGDDYQKPAAKDAFELIGACRVYVFDDGYPSAAAFVGSIVDDLHAALWMVIRPKRWKKMRKAAIPEQLVDTLFTEVGVGKLKVFVQSEQKSGVRLLERFKFRRFGTFHKETRKGGKKIDVLYYELRRDYWKKSREF